MSGQLVTIAVLHMSLEAEVMKSKLESEGIQAFIKGGHAVTSILGETGSFSVELQVADRDVARAREILDISVDGTPRHSRRREGD